MEEKILAALKNKYANLGLGDAILKGFAKKIAKTVTEENGIDTAVEGVEDDLKMWQSFNDSHRTEISALKKQLEGIKPAKQKKEKEDGKSTEGKEEGEGKEGKDGVPDWAKTLLSEMAALKGDKIVSTRRGVLEEKIKAAPDAVKNKVLRDFSRMNFKDDEDFDNFVKETETDLSEIAKAIPPKTSAKPQLSFGATDVPQARVADAIKAHADIINKDKK